MRKVFVLMIFLIVFSIISMQVVSSWEAIASTTIPQGEACKVDHQPLVDGDGENQLISGKGVQGRADVDRLPQRLRFVTHHVHVDPAGRSLGGHRLCAGGACQEQRQSDHS